MCMRMHGWRAGEVDDADDEEESKRERRRHMWTVPPRASPILAALPYSDASPSSSPNFASFFSKVYRIHLIRLEVVDIYMISLFFFGWLIKFEGLNWAVMNCVLLDLYKWISIYF